MDEYPSVMLIDIIETDIESIWGLTLNYNGYKQPDTNIPGIRFSWLKLELSAYCGDKSQPTTILHVAKVAFWIPLVRTKKYTQYNHDCYWASRHCILKYNKKIAFVTHLCQNLIDHSI